MKYYNFSGGALGCDSLFEIEEEKYGVKTVAYSFYGHNIKSKNRWVLTTEQLDEGFEHVKIANKSLNRNVTTISTYVKKLLSRNWYQVKNSDCIFAIGMLKNENEVAGGTGWAVSMSIDNKKPIYLFEQNKNSWFEYSYINNKFEKIDYIPKLTEKFAGIGTRDLNENGKKAIVELYKKNFEKIQNQSGTNR